MTTSSCLFYPTIEIHDETWLKNAILFWDEINTIVPEDLANPYKHEWNKLLVDHGILKKISVEPSSPLVKEVSVDTLRYLSTPEGYRLLNTTAVEDVFQLHKSKLADSLQFFLEDKMSTGKEWVKLDKNLSMFYMTLLATKICETKGISLLTPENSYFSLSQIVKLDAINKSDESANILNSENSFGQALLTNLIIEKVRINPDVKLTDLLAYKKNHKDELARYRNNLASLTKDFKPTENFEADREAINNIYTQQYLPAYNEFVDSLSRYSIKTATKDLLKISYISIPATGMLAMMFATPVALGIAAGFSLVTSAISYRSERKDRIANSPYSYLYNLYQKGV